MNSDYLNALLGGAIIGLATVLMMHLSGRVTGISGIVNGIFKYVAGDWAWRLTFLVGLFSGGLIMKLQRPESFVDTSGSSLPMVIAAGLLVGFGTIMGSGCTSGHGVCGISRLSKRSIVATLVFIATGVITVTLKNYFLN